MARTKGALGKKTIEKLKAQGKWDYKHNKPIEHTHNQSNIKIQHPNPNIEVKKVPLVERLRKNPELRKTIKVSNKDTDNGNSINNINSNRNPTDSPSSNNSNNERLIETKDNTEVKNNKNPENSENSEPTKTKPKNQTESKSKIKLNKELKPKTFCDACHEPIYCDANRVDTNILTSRADYFRQVPRFVNLCSKCSLELSNVVDKWLLDKGCYSKYQNAIDTQEDSNIKENINDFESESNEVVNEDSSIEENIEDSREEFQ